MEKNCLHERLTGVITDESLRFMGMLKFTASSLNVAGYIPITCNGNTRVKTTTAGAVLNATGAGAEGEQISSQEVLLFNSNTGITSSGASSLTLFVEKYNLLVIKDGTANFAFADAGLDTSEMAYCSKLQKLWTNNLIGDIKNLGGLTQLQELVLSGSPSGLQGSVNDLTALTSLTLLQFYNTSITGDVTAMLNSMAANRASGVMTLMVNSLCTNIPTGIATSYNVNSKVNFGSSMVNPTATDTERGWQVAS